MSQTFQIENLPHVDQTMIKRGLCPWCVVPLFDNDKADECPECGDVFIGVISIDD